MTSLLAGCSDDEQPIPAQTVPGVQLRFDTESDDFFALPFPSDLRLVDGKPDLTGFPNPRDNFLVSGLLDIATDRPMWPTVPVAYFAFDDEIPSADINQVVPFATDAPVMLIDVDAASAIAATIHTVAPEDDYVPANVLAVAARPGIVLEPGRRYAFVVTDSFMDAELPQAARDAELHAPLWPALEALGVDAARVIAATVFTTGDVVAELADLSERVSQAFSVSIDDLAVDADDGADHPRFCELIGSVTFPQFQRGTPPFDSDGVFEFDGDLPVEQRSEVAPIVITLPLGEMPAGGYPLAMYFHGSGGVSAQVVDRGTVTTPDGAPTKGEGPAHVLAGHGFASVGSAHPVNPERLPGASDIAYLNLDNLKAFRDTFRQGVLEQRMFLDALLSLQIDPATVATCNLTLPAGETAFSFRAEPIVAMGQSMGGMYTNLIGATDPRIRAVVPTGAGGFWSFFILETTLINGRTLVPLVLQSDAALTHLHPALHLLELAWEPAEPMVSMPRLARRPLDGHPTRPIYEPVGLDDSFFPSQLYDAIALAYGHEQAGDVVWPTMQHALALSDLDGIIDYPVSDNLTSDAGGAFTGVVVQYEGDGIYDPHAIFAQLDAVKLQYGCFFETFLATGSGVVVAPDGAGNVQCSQSP